MAYLLKYVIFSCFFISYGYLSANALDTVRKSVKNLSDNEKMLIDTSLRNYHLSTYDTSRLNILDHIIENSKDDDVWPIYNEVMLAISQKKLSEKSLAENEKTFYKIKLGNALNNIGFLAYHQGNIKKALEFYNKSLKIREVTNDKLGLANSYTNIGLVYSSQNYFDNALSNYNKSFDLYKELNYENGKAKSLHYIGLVYLQVNKLDTAMSFFNQSLDIRMKTGDQNGQAQSLSYIGDIYEQQKQYQKALENYSECLLIGIGIGETNGLAITHYKIADIYFQTERIKEGEYHAIESLKYARKTGYPNNIKNTALLLYRIHASRNRWKEALEMHELFTLMKDSLYNIENQKMAFEQELKYDYEKKLVADSIVFTKKQEIKEAEIAKHHAELKLKRNQQNWLFGGIVLLLIFVGFVFNRFKISQKQKLIIEAQKVLVESRNKDITDSIIYAKRIQTAIFPPQKLIKQYLEESFILYLPKDIVAGDFYWFETTEDKIFFAAADCTGHGVPGAMVSVMCSNALTKAVKELGVFEPGKILDKAAEILEERFSKSEEKVSDGMDVALCILDLKNSKLEYAGANNPLCLIRNGELLTIKADKQPIGKFENRQPFTSHNMVLLKGDSIYIFSDGYVDQFGGPKGKKFKYAQLKELLLANAEKPMAEQKDMLDKTFETWKGDLEQVDDVCIIGVRI